jgi:hypothetical protein
LPWVAYDCFLFLTEETLYNIEHGRNYGALLHSSMSTMDNTIQYHGGLQTRKFGHNKKVITYKRKCKMLKKM